MRAGVMVRRYDIVNGPFLYKGSADPFNMASKMEPCKKQVFFINVLCVLVSNWSTS